MLVVEAVGLIILNNEGKSLFRKLALCWPVTCLLLLSVKGPIPLSERQRVINILYRRCRPECLLNNDCPVTKACIKRKCVDPCPGVCGVDALCEVVNHNPICYCPKELTGDPFLQCIKRKSECFLSNYHLFSTITTKVASHWQNKATKGM